MRKAILFFLTLAVFTITSYASIWYLQKIPINPIPWTNSKKIVTSLAVDTTNRTDVSIDFLWYLYDDEDSLVDEGRIQIADSILSCYLQRGEGFEDTFICNRLGLIFAKE